MCRWPCSAWCFSRSWGFCSARRRGGAIGGEIRAARLAWSLIGVGTALWLVYAELFKIDAICLWCTAVHVITLAVFVTTIFGTVSTSLPPPRG